MMLNEMKIFQTTGTLDQLPEIAKQITSLISDKPFCLWLQGNLGAGKTTFTGYILRSLGLPDIIPVTSPTFAYVNEYEIHGKTYAHLDLYRIDSDDFALEDLGINEERDFAGLFVEWPDKIKDHSDMIPTHLLQITASEDLSERAYLLSSIS